MDIFIRADGSQKIGMGHMIRCISLAHMIKSTFRIVFVCKEIPQQTIEELRLSNFELIQILSEDTFFELLKNRQTVVLDGYTFDINYQKRIKELSCNLICIDDLYNQEFIADLIINHAPGVISSNYKTSEGTDFALGHEYALLRPAFLKQAAKKKEFETYARILICFGGADAKNLTESILKIVLTYGFLDINVITGPAYKINDSMIRLIESDKRINHYHALQENELLEVMLNSDVAIVPSSGILFEALAAGCKVISGYYVSNQVPNYNGYKKLNAIIDAKDFTEEPVRNAIDNISQDVNKQLIDGNSGTRILNKIRSVIVKIRPADVKDSLLLFNWANDDLVRNNAINKERILWENHSKWLEGKLVDSNSKIFIMEMNQVPVGQIRYDKQDDAWIIDYSIEDCFRGFGLGKELLKKTIPFFADFKLRAFVNTTNIASICLFKRQNFKFLHEEKIANENYLIFEL
jgi:UDP-2,4-diacetamido-2,4,6-trideoxy-beta-L-altropyranose hydrolase